MAKILVEVRPSGMTGDLSGQPPVTEAFLSRVNDLGQSLKEISAQLSKHLDNLGEKDAKVAAYELREAALPVRQLSQG